MTSFSRLRGPGTSSLLARGFGAALLVGGFAACNGGATAPGYDTVTGVGIGGTCDENKKCRDGLTCGADGKCAAAGTSKEGDPCLVGDECASGICGPATTAAKGKCQKAGTGAAGDGCGGDNDCGKGLRCAFDGTSMFPKCVAAGTSDVNDTCTSNKDCRQGLLCQAGKCGSAIEPAPGAYSKGVPPFVPGLDSWKGATCPDPKVSAGVALFKVPRAGDSHEDFYRLPFPNDAARDKSTGKVSFANHPHDPKPPMGFDAVKRYLDVLEAEPFGPYATSLFRFDHDFEFDTVKIGVEAKAQTTVVDLTPGATFGQRRGLNVFVTNGRNRYICANSVGVRPNRADPYKPGGTYAVLMKKGVKRCDARDSKGACSTIGADFEQDADFAALIADTAPSDAKLADAWNAYKPLRDLMVKEGMAKTDVLVANVFTVGDPRTVASRLRTSARAGAAPKVDPWVKCAAGVKSPCPQADDKDKRACPAADSPDFDEYHGMIEVPVYQQGTAPYLSEGGAFSTAGGPSEPITSVRTEKVCAALTVPKGTAPAGGWPIALYAHGTGGSFRSHAVDGAAKTLSKITVAGGTEGFAVLGIDQVQHGPRRGSSTASPNDLFFNFANPQAARYNALQGAADQHTLVRVAEALTVEGGPKLDGTKIVFWGHSQGATEGALFLAADTTIKGAVFSGQGAGLIDSLLSKTQPVNIKDSLWIALSESSPTAIGEFHPVLSLLQSWTDPSDPLHVAQQDIVVPGATPFARHVFQLVGKGDTYSPFNPQINYAFTAQLAWVGPVVEPIGDNKPVDSVQGNAGGAAKVTAAFRQYTPAAGRDGHFVAFDVDQAKGDLSAFLARVSRGETPKIPE